jgi:CubicO group peptidase (beta-lactamase class C family)
MPSVVTDIDHYIANEVRLQSFSGTVLLAQNGKVLLDKAYGWADEEQQLTNKPTTRFGIGSITKQFTAMAILLLQERHKLRVQDPVCMYISGCPASWKPITIDELLTHTSGIPDYLRSLSEKAKPPSESLLHYIERQPLDFAPGSNFSYSNSGYAVLGYVIEDLAAQPYADFLQQEIFDPLHLADTGYLETSPPSSPVPMLATGYTETGVKATPSIGTPLLAAGSLFSTTADLYRWDGALFNRTFSSRDSLIRMFAPHVTYCGSAATICSASQCAAEAASCYSYGYGWFVGRQAFGTNLLPVYWHSGLVPGFASYNSYYPNQKLILIMLSNFESSSAYEPAMAGAIVAKVLRQTG